MEKNKKFNEVKFYEKYINFVTCAFKKNIIIDCKGKERCFAKRTKERKNYLFKGLKADLSDNIVLIECPTDILTIELEKEFKRTTDGKEIIKKADKEQLDKWLSDAEDNCKQLNLDYCIVSHNGTSDYLYLCNLKGLVEGNEKSNKKEIAKKLLPKEAHDFLDLSNLGKTLIPIINRPHWKFKKNQGRIHKIIRGKNPDEHINNISYLFEAIETEPVVIKYNSNSDLNDISITSVISTSGFRTTGNGELEGSNPWHGSTHGHNFNINPSKNVWHCNRCDSGGSVAEAIAVQHNILECADIQRGCLRGDKFIQVLEVARSHYGLKELDALKPKGYAISLNIKEIAQEKDFLNCPDCNTPFQFNEIMGWYKCKPCNTFGGLKKFIKLNILNKHKQGVQNPLPDKIKCRNSNSNQNKGDKKQ